MIMTNKDYESKIAELEAEISALQAKVDFANKCSAEATERFFERQRKIQELYKRIDKYETEKEKDIKKAVKEAKFEAEKAAVERCCDIFDDCIGFHAYEYTDKLRKGYKIPTKYGF